MTQSHTTWFSHEDCNIIFCFVKVVFVICHSLFFLCIPTSFCYHIFCLSPYLSLSLASAILPSSPISVSLPLSICLLLCSTHVIDISISLSPLSISCSLCFLSFSLFLFLFLSPSHPSCSLSLSLSLSVEMCGLEGMTHTREARDCAWCFSQPPACPFRSSTLARTLITPLGVSDICPPGGAPPCPHTGHSRAGRTCATQAGGVSLRTVCDVRGR